MKKIPESTLDKLYWLTLECVKWSQVHSLTAYRQPERFVNGHIIDSLYLYPALQDDSHPRSWLDFGCGPGFPGLVMALLKPQDHMVLLDANSKKMAFARHAIFELALNSVTVAHKRVEDYQPVKPIDRIVARAVAPIASIIKSTQHIFEDQGQYWLLKGPGWADEAKGYSVDSVCLAQSPGRYLVIIEHQPKKNVKK